MSEKVNVLFDHNFTLNSLDLTLGTTFLLAMATLQVYFPIYFSTRDAMASQMIRFFIK